MEMPGFIGPGMKEGLRRSGATAEALTGGISFPFLGVTRVGGNL
jgi:hypothetical protein